MSQLTEETVTAAIDDFVSKWNSGDLEGACEVYAYDASFVSPNEYIRDKEKILTRYRTAYADPKNMGKLTLTILEFRVDDGRPVTMASAILKWELKFDDGKEDEGYCLEVYAIRDGKVRMVQDATV